MILFAIKPDLLSEFIKICENNILGMREYIHDVTPNVNVRIILGDSTKDNDIPSDSVDFIITSPPYGDSRIIAAYGQFSRLSAQRIPLKNSPTNEQGKIGFTMQKKSIVLLKKL